MPMKRGYDPTPQNEDDRTATEWPEMVAQPAPKSEREKVMRAVYDGTSTDPSDKLFDVTAIVGSVYRGGKFSPRVAAFMLIAEHGADGEYSYPDEDGSIVWIGVNTVQAKTDE